jgi:dephospho-CoA kinase
MLKVGITGGMGSGKTTVAHIFETLGIPVYYADDAAKRIMNEDPSLRMEIIRIFGDESYNGEGLNRSYIASKVFSNPEQLNMLNAIVHPATIRDGENWMKRQNSPYALKEAALIFESGAAEGLDYVIGVSAPIPLRIERVIQRDGMERSEIKARMAKQLDPEIAMKLCDFVIQNNEQELLIPQVLKIHEELKAKGFHP